VSFAVKFPASPDRILIAPFVPYALALSLSVSYRKMRYSQIPLYRLRGKTRFKEVVALLRELSHTFTCARINAGLGEAILQEMDKTAKELANSSAAAAAAAASTPTTASASGSGGGGTTPSPTEKPRPPPPAAAHRKSLPAEVTLGSKRNIFVREADRHHQNGGTVATPRPIQAGQSPLQQLPAPGQVQQGQGRPSPAPLSSTTTSTTAPSQGAALLAAQQQQQQQQAGASSQALPATALGDMLDVDIFGHFDPGFDLNTIDAALSANLDMGFPQMWTTPWPNWPS
jgi:hypothetical protein